MEFIDNNINIGTRPIKIHIRSNLLGGQSDTILTRNLLFDAVSKESNGDKNIEETPEIPSSEYPYFTDATYYDLSKFKNFSREQIIETFFNKDQFQKEFYTNSDTLPSDSARHSNATHNVMVMLQLLFPTSFPINGNLHDTFIENIKKETTYVPQNLSMLPTFISNLVGSDNKNQFGYIRHSSGIYTIMEAFWINDVINHPEYSKLFRELSNSAYYVKHEQSKLIKLKADVETEFMGLYTKFYSAFNNESNASIKDSIITYSENASNRTTKGIDPKLVSSVLQHLPQPTTIPTEIDKIIGKWFDLYKIKIDAAKYNSNQDIIPPELKRSFPTTARLLELASEHEYLIESNNYLNNIRAYNIFMNKKPANLEPWELELREKLLKNRKISNAFNQMKQYIAPLRGCSNQKLQDMLNSFAKNGLNYNQNPDNIQYVSDLLRNGKSNINGPIDALEIGVMSNQKVLTQTEDVPPKKEGAEVGETEEKYYEIFIQLNCIKGILDKTNLPLIKCSYENSNLVRIYNHLKHPLLKKNPMLLYSNFPLIDLKSLMPKTPNQTGGYTTKRKRHGDKSLKLSVRSLKYGGKKTRKNRKSKNVRH